jgi:hypothetical protein
VDGVAVDTSFALEAWQRVIRDRRRPGKLVRRHFEVCVFSHLADELRSGDVAVVGSASYANWQTQLLPWEECEPMVAGYCAEAGLPSSPSEFTDGLRTRLAELAASVDAGYPDNADLMIDEGGRAVLKARKGKERRTSALAARGGDQGSAAGALATGHPGPREPRDRLAPPLRPALWLRPEAG